MTRILAWLLVMWSLAAAMPGQAAEWPMPELPRGTQVDSAGEEIKLNNMPMKISRFDAPMRYDDAVRFFRERFGRERVENVMSGDLLIAQRRKDHFVTVRLRPAGDRTMGILAVSDLRQDGGGKKSAHFSLPAESAVLSDLESVDAGKKSRQLLVMNKQSMDANRAHFLRVLEREDLKPGRTEKSLDSQVVWLDGKGKDALLVITKNKEFSQVLITMMSQE